MPALFHHIYRTGRPATVLILLMLTAGLPLHAQNPAGGKPDTVLVDQAPSTDTMTPVSPDSPASVVAGDTAVPPLSRSIPDSTVARWSGDPDLAYANDPAYWVPYADKNGDDSRENKFERYMDKLLGSRLFTWFIYLLLAAVLVYALYKIIAGNNLRFFYRSPRSASPGPAGEEDLIHEDLDGKLQQALTAKDHRMAVRYLYWKTLRLLNEQELIRYHVQATNEEYRRQLSGSDREAPFSVLTRAYEHVWYGDFSLHDGQFEWLLGYFQDFFKSISHGHKSA